MARTMLWVVAALLIVGGTRCDETTTSETDAGTTGGTEASAANQTDAAPKGTVTVETDVNGTAADQAGTVTIQAAAEVTTQPQSAENPANIPPSVTTDNGMDESDITTLEVPSTTVHLSLVPVDLPDIISGGSAETSSAAPVETPITDAPPQAESSTASAKVSDSQTTAPTEVGGTTEPAVVLVVDKSTTAADDSDSQTTVPTVVTTAVHAVDPLTTAADVSDSQTTVPTTVEASTADAAFPADDQSTATTAVSDSQTTVPTTVEASTAAAAFPADDQSTATTEVADSQTTVHSTVEDTTSASAAVLIGAVTTDGQELTSLTEAQSATNVTIDTTEAPRKDVDGEAEDTVTLNDLGSGTSDDELVSIYLDIISTSSPEVSGHRHVDTLSSTSVDSASHPTSEQSETEPELSTSDSVEERGSATATSASILQMTNEIEATSAALTDTELEITTVEPILKTIKVSESEVEHEAVTSESITRGTETFTSDAEITEAGGGVTTGEHVSFPSMNTTSAALDLSAVDSEAGETTDEPASETREALSSMTTAGMGLETFTTSSTSAEVDLSVVESETTHMEVEGTSTEPVTVVNPAGADLSEAVETEFELTTIEPMLRTTVISAMNSAGVEPVTTMEVMGPRGDISVEKHEGVEAGADVKTTEPVSRTSEAFATTDSANAGIDELTTVSTADVGRETLVTSTASAHVDPLVQDSKTADAEVDSITLESISRAPETLTTNIDDAHVSDEDGELEFSTTSPASQTDHIIDMKITLPAKQDGAPEVSSTLLSTTVSQMITKKVPVMAKTPSYGEPPKPATPGKLATITIDLNKVTKADDKKLTSVKGKPDYSMTSEVKVEEGSPCHNPTVIEQDSRHFSSGYSAMEPIDDRTLNSDKWYQFKYQGDDAVITNSAIHPDHCGTKVPYHVELKKTDEPEVGENVTSKICATDLHPHRPPKDCDHDTEIEITIHNCGAFFIYQLGSNGINKFPPVAEALCIQKKDEVLPMEYRTGPRWVPVIPDADATPDMLANALTLLMAYPHTPFDEQQYARLYDKGIRCAIAKGLNQLIKDRLQPAVDTPNQGNETGNTSNQANQPTVTDGDTDATTETATGPTTASVTESGTTAIDRSPINRRRRRETIVTNESDLHDCKDTSGIPSDRSFTHANIYYIGPTPRMEGDKLQLVIVAIKNGPTVEYRQSDKRRKRSTDGPTVVSAADLKVAVDNAKKADGTLGGDLKVESTSVGVPPDMEHRPLTAWDNYKGLFLTLIILAILIVIGLLIGLFCQKCLYTQGSWTRPDEKPVIMEEGKKRPLQSVENPLSDDEIKKGESPMLQSAPPVKNGSHPPYTKQDEENGWVVPIDQIVPSEKDKGDVEDTRL